MWDNDLKRGMEYLRNPFAHRSRQLQQWKPMTGAQKGASFEFPTGKSWRRQRIFGQRRSQHTVRSHFASYSDLSLHALVRHQGDGLESCNARLEKDSWRLDIRPRLQPRNCALRMTRISVMLLSAFTASPR